MHQLTVQRGHDEYAVHVALLLAAHSTLYFLSLQLEQMGFDLDLVLEVFFACDKDEHLAANYPLDHMNKFDDEAQQ